MSEIKAISKEVMNARLTSSFAFVQLQIINEVIVNAGKNNPIEKRTDCILSKKARNVTNKKTK